MELAEIIEKMQSPEKLVEPTELVNIIGYIDGFITHYELDVDELEVQQSFRWDEVQQNGENSVKNLTDKQTAMRMVRDKVSIDLKKTKRTLSELKRYRNYLYRKLDLIMGIKRR